MEQDQETRQAITLYKSLSARLLGSLILGAISGVFIGVLAMAIAMLLFGILPLIIPNAQRNIAGLSMPVVTFVIFCALGWASVSIYIWLKFPTIFDDAP